MLNGERLKTFPLRSETRYECLFQPFSIQHCTGRSKAIRQENRIKDMHIGKEEVKIPLFSDDMLFESESESHLVLSDSS